VDYKSTQRIQTSDMNRRHRYFGVLYYKKHFSFINKTNKYNISRIINDKQANFTIYEESQAS